MEEKATTNEKPQADNELFAKRLKTLRLAKGYKHRREFAEKLSEKDGKTIEVNSVYRWESAIRTPSFKTVRNIAQLLNTSVSYLVGEIDNPEPLTADNLPVKEDVGAVYSCLYIPILEEREGEVVKFPIAESFVERYAHEYGAKNLWVVVMRGDAMSPRFNDGDYILFTKTDDVLDSDIVVAVYRKKIFIRGYFPDKDGKVRLKALNSQHPDKEVNASELDVRGVVRARIPLLVRDNGFY